MDGSLWFLIFLLLIFPGTMGGWIASVKRGYDRNMKEYKEKEERANAGLG